MVQSDHDLGGLDLCLVRFDPDVFQSAALLFRSDADVFQSAADVGGLNLCLVGSETVALRLRMSKSSPTEVGFRPADLGSLSNEVGFQSNEVGFQSAKALLQSAACGFRLDAVECREIASVLPRFAAARPLSTSRRMRAAAGCSKPKAHLSTPPTG